ncbi:MAG: response regulator [Candidatus Omnitrophica bacterium]|nr:response regulator [Candidatus Omnitrophota bacterium]MDD5671558.1 response regulator [Candidatus Omnitrophota bacterium]
MTKKILMIDDDADLCEEISEILLGKGYAVETVCDGLEGWRAIQKDGYDVILLDIKIPRMNGIDILKKIREKKIKTKVMLLSASPVIDKSLGHQVVFTDDDSENVINLADDMMCKPYDVEIFLRKIDRLIDTKTA